MKLAIMQPYFFPYVGYFQLISCVDKFVFLDDVNYIKRGWINRNRLLVGENPKYFTAALLGASQNRKINEIELSDNNWKSKILQTALHHYKKAPGFEVTYNLLHNTLNFDSHYISELAKASIRNTCGVLGISREWVDSSSVFDQTLKGQGRILHICKELGAKTYINAIGGQKLYDENIFLEQGISLKFIKTDPLRENENLSIVHLLMTKGADEVKKMLNSYQLISGTNSDH